MTKDCRTKDLKTKDRRKCSFRRRRSIAPEDRTLLNGALAQGRQKDDLSFRSFILSSISQSLNFKL